MQLDKALLEAHRSFEHAGLGISERFVNFVAGPGETLGVLSMPLDRAVSPIGWVMCHSFAMEELNLNMLHVNMARRLAAQGFPVLRFYCQGYGDSAQLGVRPGPSSHIADTEDAVRFMSRLPEIGSVGTCGIRFGGTVAAAVAASLGLDHMALVAPIVDTRRYMKELMRIHSFSTLAGGADATDVSVADLRNELRAEGTVNLKGFILDRDTFDAMGTFRLEEATQGFTGDALIVQLSRTEKLQPGLRSFSTRLETGGARVRLEVVIDPAASNLGQPPVRHVRSDTLVNSSDDLGKALVEATISGLESLTR